MRKAVIAVAVFIALVVGTTALALGLGWFQTGADIVSPENVKKQWKFAYTYDESLDAAAGNWCTAKKAEASATADAKTERASQTIAREASYNSIKAKYDAELKNAFEAKWVKPDDVPTQAPTLQEKVKELALTCE